MPPRSMISGVSADIFAQVRSTTPSNRQSFKIKRFERAVIQTPLSKKASQYGLPINEASLTTEGTPFTVKKKRISPSKIKKLTSMGSMASENSMLQQLKSNIKALGPDATEEEKEEQNLRKRLLRAKMHELGLIKKKSKQTHQ